MRKLSANYIFLPTGKLLHNGIIVLDDDNKITDLIDTEGQLRDAEKIEFYNGILVPGFVNTHCHLELSHLHKKIEKHTRLSGFIQQLIRSRKADYNEIHSAIEIADDRMISEGIVAVGDISNSSDSFFQKQISKIKYHTFIEIYSSDREKAKSKFTAGLNLLNDTKTFYSLSASLSPHAPYSLSNKLLALITTHVKEQKSVISLHNQETLSENDLFISKSGELYDLLCRLDTDYSEWIPTRKNSLDSISEFLPQENKLLLVHNTYTTEADIETAANYFKNIYWCLCPNANLFIENKLPEIDLLYRKNQKITIGTDSLASNDKLSILEELKTINKSFPQIPLTELFRWATINGAEALNFESDQGSIEIGKTPGINLIGNTDLQNLKLTDSSFVKVLV
jgi:cytosine/adenosine deaminase-related metal-dependent hydrolase